MIQRGFGEKVGKHHHVWVFRKDGPAYRTSTPKHGFEKDFYTSTDGDTYIDDMITAFENEKQSYLQELRRCSGGTKVDSEFAAPLVSHFALRSKFLRDQLSDTVERLRTWFLENMSKEDNLKRLLEAYVRSHPELVGKHVDKLGASQSQRDALRNIVDITLPDLIEDDISSIKSNADGLLSLFRQLDLEKSVKDAHLEAMKGGFDSIARTELYRSLQYSTVVTSGEIILPDTGIAFLAEKPSPLIQPKDGSQEIFIPIHSNVYIHGYQTFQIERHVRTVTRILASCSYETFLAKSRNDAFTRLTPQIGKYAKLLREKDFRDILSIERLMCNL
jgi:hypothetical protein